MLCMYVCICVTIRYNVKFELLMNDLLQSEYTIFLMQLVNLNAYH